VEARLRLARTGGFVLTIAVVTACVGARVRGGIPTEPLQTARATARTAGAAPVKLRPEIVATYPHDPNAFTQGLVLEGATLYESTGLEGRSSLRRVDLETGRVLQRSDQSPPIFSEGLAVVGTRLVQLTWKNGIVYEYDKKTFQRTREWGYSGEGWGACYDGVSLVTSDGSERLAYRDPSTMAIRREVRVTLSGQPLSALNGLECVDGSVWANVWNTDTIVRIDPKSGRVTGHVDAPGLLSAAERQQTDVMNGIAYDAATRTFLVTGKLWPKLFRVRFVPAS
jgi:glutamine cyclotransferase